MVQTTCCSQHPVGRHKKSWEVVNAYVERCLKVGVVKPEQTVLPTILPWLDKTLEDMTFMRSTLEEGIIIWVNLTTCGVVPSMKKNFITSFVTGVLSAMNNSLCVLLHTNREAEAKAS